MGKKIMKETNIFKVLADQQRREILIMLKDGRLNAGEIAEKLQVGITRQPCAFKIGRAHV